MVATLSVSGPTLGDCAGVVRAMRALGIAGDMTRNESVLDGGQEPGCRVRVASQPSKEQARRLWVALRGQHALTCAHVLVGDAPTSGCVLDVFRPSLCTGAEE